ncbi:sensor histidine kinase [Frigidibacter sp. MR17.24]|uniref:sensor histidine kinase n=1 Tax=Frigidibacter sp. MR17.24 TaxID=3127345 RepID=UPI003012E790
MPPIFAQDNRPDEPGTGFADAAWADVLQAVDRTYADLVDYQERLERQNDELDALRGFLASVLGAVSDVLLVTGRDDRVSEANASFRALTGREAVIGAEVAPLFAEPGALSATLAAARSQRRAQRVEIAILTPAGPAPLDLSVSPLLDERGRATGAVLSGRPLGELRRAYAALADSHRALQEAQTQLVRNEKLASLGRLLAGVAHELNNPISFVYANAHALERYATKFETYFTRVQEGASRDELVRLREELRLDRELRNLRDAISGARDGAERVRDIVEDLRRLSADGSGEMVAFDLAETARVAAAWVQRGARHPVAIGFEGAGKVMARGRPGHVQQVVMNLVQNAVDALAGQAGPRITLTLGHEDGMACVTVADTGPGIPEGSEAAVFDPFYTTKPVGAGTGLGLSISHKIAEEHGGSLRLLRVPGLGAVFRLALPAAEGGA